MLATVEFLFLQVFIAFMGIKSDAPVFVALTLASLSAIPLAEMLTHKKIFTLRTNPIKELKETNVIEYPKVSMSLKVFGIMCIIFGLFIIVCGWMQFFNITLT
jgi:pilus assembly protein TadC